MRIAYLECFSGISGDMLLGALADAGAPREQLASLPAKLGLAQATVRFERTERSNISALRAIVTDGSLVADPEHTRAKDHDHDHAPGHHHEHTHAAAGKKHTHDEAHERVLGHTHSQAGENLASLTARQPGHVHRSLAAIEEMISAAELPESARRRAIAVFRRLGEAEARIHGIPVEKVHFHEVGAVDSIIDIVGACLGFELLGVDKIYCSALNVGGGVARMAHGVLPVPAPATLDLLQSAGAPVYSSGDPVELVTPTGAAVVATLAAGFGAMPAMRLLSAGYGAGGRDLPGRPNVLRIVLGEAPAAGAQPARQEPAASEPAVCVIEANIDDMNPQLAGHLTERLLEAGALDVFYTPVQMKKNRAGVLVSLIVAPADRDRMARLLFEETTTIGVRVTTAERITLDRAHVTVDTNYGPIRVKVSRHAGRVLNFAPEYDDCRKAAHARGVPLKMVLAEASFRYLEKYGKEINP